eukprot:8754861-Alexandrium_andersonii.AAC.1
MCIRDSPLASRLSVWSSPIASRVSMAAACQRGAAPPRVERRAPLRPLAAGAAGALLEAPAAA